MPFDVYYTEIDSELSEYIIYYAVFIQNRLQSNDLKDIFNEKYLELLRLTSRLVEHADRAHAYVHVAEITQQFGEVRDNGISL